MLQTAHLKTESPFTGRDCGIFHTRCRRLHSADAPGFNMPAAALAPCDAVPGIHSV